MPRKSAYILFLAVLGLLVIGIVMLFSTSAFARDSHGDVYFFIRRQAIWFGTGLVACTFAALIDYHFWQRTWWLWFLIALVALALCYFPHIGMRINGSRRWIGLGRVTFQPSELAKLAAIFFLAAWFTRYETARHNVLFSIAFPAAIVALLAVLILGEVDLGSTALLGATAFVVMFIGGANPLWLGFGAVASLSTLLVIATQISQRMGRLSAFLHPEIFKEDAGLQQMQALIAWGSGGIDGLAHRFHFSNHRRRAWSAFQSTRCILICDHHCVRNHDCAPCQGPFRFAPRLRHCLAASVAGGGEYRGDHLAFAEQRPAVAFHQLRRLESRRLYVWDRFVAEYLSPRRS